MAAIDLQSGMRGLHGLFTEQLARAIGSGVIKPGDQIDPKYLETEYDISRTVVREALRTLQAKGMISARPNVGTLVRPRADWNLLDPDVMRWSSTGRGDDPLVRDRAELVNGLEALGRLQPELSQNVYFAFLLRLLATEKAPPTFAPSRAHAEQAQHAADVTGSGGMDAGSLEDLSALDGLDAADDLLGARG